MDNPVPKSLEHKPKLLRSVILHDEDTTDLFLALTNWILRLCKSDVISAIAFLFFLSVSQESWWRHCQGHRWLEGPEDHREADHPEQTGSGTYHHDQTHRLIVFNMNRQGWFKGSRYPKRKIQPKSPRNGKTVLQRSVNWSSCRLVLKSKNKMSPCRHQV